jgi:adenylate cyclase
MARATTLVDRAIALNPASAFVWLISGSVQIKNGRPDLAAEHLETAMRLDPISSMNAFARMYLASARFQQGRLDEASALYMTTSLRLPVSYAVLAALHGHRGDLGEAQEALRRLRDISSGSIDEFARIWFPRPEHRKLFLDGIALAEGKSPAAP